MDSSSVDTDTVMDDGVQPDVAAASRKGEEKETRHGNNNGPNSRESVGMGINHENELAEWPNLEIASLPETVDDDDGEVFLSMLSTTQLKDLLKEVSRRSPFSFFSFILSILFSFNASYCAFYQKTISGYRLDSIRYLYIQRSSHSYRL